MSAGGCATELREGNEANLWPRVSEILLITHYSEIIY